jgi:hypothetical protein
MQIEEQYLGVNVVVSFTKKIKMELLDELYLYIYLKVCFLSSNGEEERREM